MLSTTLNLKRSDWVIYELDWIIDFWAGSKTVQEYCRDCLREESQMSLDEIELSDQATTISETYRYVEAIMRLCPYCKELSDLRQDPCIICLPSDESFETVGYCFKHDCGATYVVAEVRYKPFWDFWFKFKQVGYSLIKGGKR